MVGLLGAECTGKTTLARDLVMSFTRRCPVAVTPEALRDFVREHDRTPRQDEQGAIMAAQVANEHAAIAEVTRAAMELPDPNRHPVVIGDSCPLMTSIYSMAYFSDSQLLAAGLIHQRVYDLVLWCSPDMPWTADPGQRDGLDRRTQVAELLAEVVTDEQVPVVAIAGDRDARLRQAMEKIQQRQYFAVGGPVRAIAIPPE